MQFKLCGRSSEKYVVVEPLNLVYKENPLGILVRDTAVKDIAAGCFEVGPCPEPFKNRIIDILGKEVENIRIVAEKLGLPPFRGGVESINEYEDLIAATVKELTEIDLSDSKLTCIPFIIRKFEKLEKIKLANNPLRVWGVDLQNLKHLIEIDDSNTELNICIPEWLSQVRLQSISRIQPDSMHLAQSA